MDEETKLLLQKAERYCAYQERCHSEVRTKLLNLGARGQQLEVIIAELISTNFLNEERFAKAFAGGRFRTKKWGRRKIVVELKKRRVSDYSIRKGLQEIPDIDYENTLLKLAEKKVDSLSGQAAAKRTKAARYLIGRGYESNLVWGVLRKLLPY